MSKNEKSRKYQLTINNPKEHAYTHDIIKDKMNSITNVYWCMCDEIGENGTPHTHMFFCSENAVLFSTVKNHFPEAHIEAAKGSSQDNRDYIRKEGRHLNSEKGCITLLETFEDFGEMPLDKSTKNETVSEQVLQMLEDGFSNLEIIREFPSYITKGKYLDDVRQELNKEKFGNVFRDVKVHYIYGASRTGKTRFVMDTYGYENVFRVSSYKNPFDGYKGQSVLLLDEFNSPIPIEYLLKILEGYPFDLDARYNSKVACYTEVYIISNLPLNKQYGEIQYNYPEQWNALINRISTISRYEFTNTVLQNDDNSQVITILENIDDYKIRGHRNV